MSVNPKRHIAKTITWRIIASSTTFLVTYLVTGSLVIGGTVALIAIPLKTLLYYLHERIWYKFSKFGVKKDK